jgi:hypothetical protein
VCQADDSPEYFARMLEGADRDVLVDEVIVLRDKIMYQPYAWLDAFIAAKGTYRHTWWSLVLNKSPPSNKPLCGVGLTNLLTLLERNAKQLRHVNNDACSLHYEALHCYKILIRIKLKDVLGTTGAAPQSSFNPRPLLVNCRT